uniref:Helicase n=1 Tax=candidate division WOR-3 bacterium TaxID=2052148 RepID=A0A7C3Z213_UNCW3
MIDKFIKWLARILGVSLEPPFEIVDNLDVFVKDKLNSMLDGAKSFDIATGYFQISGWQAFADSVDAILKNGGKVRLLIGNVSREYLLPQTARFLLHLIKNPQIEARTIKPRLLHAKVFMAKTDDKLRLLFGSSNVTFGGIEANIELNTYEILDLDSKKAKSFIEWYEKLWQSAVPIDEELELEITLAGQKEAPIPITIEDPNKALFLSLLIKDLARVDLRDIGNFAPLKFQYVDAVAGVNRFFFQPGGKRGLMLAHEVGLGKTIISGMVLKHLIYHKHIKNALIVAPLSIIRQWMEDLRSKFDIQPVEITSRRLKGFVPEDFKVYIISYDLLRERIEDFHKNWNLIIVDESHFIRNSQTLRFKAVKELKSKFFLLLTATPMHNKIEDIATQLFLFVPEEIISKATKREISKVDRTKLFKTFIKRRFQKKELSEIIPERNVLPPEVITLSEKEKEIYEKLREFLSKNSQYYQIISRSIEHIAPFVKQRYLEEFISSKGAAIFALQNLKERINDAITRGFIEYNSGMLKKETEGLVADEIRSFIEDELEAQSTIETKRDEEGNLIVRLSIDEKIKEGLKSDIKFLDEIIKEIEIMDEFTKVKRIIKLIREIKPSKDKKIVVFVGFIKTGEKLVEILKNEGIKSGFFHGELEEAQRGKLIEKLWSKDEERIDVLVSTDAAYVGLNLQIADTIIHHDLSWNPMVVEQRVGRIHRIGQKREITSFSFLCKDTIDKRKHEILTGKLEEISTHLGMSYSVVLSEVAISSEIEKLMAQFELKEIDEEMLKDGLKKHITERKEIFELLEELPSEEAGILQIGFTNDLIENIENIIGEILKLGRKTFDFKFQPIMENQDFIVLDYEKNGKRIEELSTLKEKALLTIKPEEVQVWKESYKFDNLNPTYLGPFHPVVRKTTDLLIEQNFGKFWKKKITNGKETVSIYLLVPIKIKNPSAEIDTSIEILTPILYEIDRKEIEINAVKAYELACCGGKIECLNEKDTEILEKAKEELSRRMNTIKDKIRADIEKVRIEIEELALQRQRLEIKRKIEEKTKKLESLNREINRKRNSGLRYEKEMQEAKKLEEELEDLLKKLERVPESSLLIEFEEPQIAGGCIYIS